MFIPVLLVTIRLGATPSIGCPGELPAVNCLGDPILPEHAVLAAPHPAAHPNSFHANLLHLQHFVGVVFNVD